MTAPASPTAAATASSRTATSLVPLFVAALMNMFLEDTIGPWGTAATVVLASFASVALGHPGKIGRSISYLAFVGESLVLACVILAFVLHSSVGKWLGFAAGCAILIGLIVGAVRAPASTQPEAAPSAPQNRAS